MSIGAFDEFEWEDIVLLIYLAPLAKSNREINGLLLSVNILHQEGMEGLYLVKCANLDKLRDALVLDSICREVIALPKLPDLRCKGKSRTFTVI